MKKIVEENEVIANETPEYDDILVFTFEEGRIPVAVDKYMNVEEFDALCVSLGIADKVDADHLGTGCSVRIKNNLDLNDSYIIWSAEEFVEDNIEGSWDQFRTLCHLP
jgi:hypothetical protein